MLLHAHNVACVRAGHLLFSGLSFVNEPGQAIALTGPNGVGKSSLLRMVAGLLPCHAGHFALTDPASPPSLSMDDEDGHLGPFSHYLGHREAIKASLSVREMLSFWTGFLSCSSPVFQAPPLIAEDRNSPERTFLATTTPESALDQVGLAALADVPCQLLSAGQRRRLTLARLLSVARPVWLLDEPTTALDAAGQDLLWSLCNRHLAAGGVIMVATHAELPIANRIIALGRSAS